MAFGAKRRNGKRAAKKAVHAHERKMHPGKKLTKLPGGAKRRQRG